MAKDAIRTSSPPAAVPGEVLPTGELRRGVDYPDWAATRASAARAAVAGIVAATGEVAGWSDCGETADRLRAVILRSYGHRGRAPDLDELARNSGLSGMNLESGLRELVGRDMIVRDDESGDVTGAYPFTDAETGHRIRIGDRTVNAMCAVGALGVATMLGEDATIHLSCAVCDRAVRIETASRGETISAAEPAGIHIWAGLPYDGQAARSLCWAIVFVWSAGHLEAWQERDAAMPGVALDLDEALQAGRALFGPLLRGLPD